MLLRLLLVLTAYLLGSIPFGYLLIKFIFTEGEDIRDVGSGGIGATNVTRRAGRAAGVLTYLLDVAKGAAAVLLIRTVESSDYLWIGLAAIAAIAGHIAPVFLGFRGGKGVATGVGVFLVLAPYSVLSSLILWVGIVYFSRYVSLGSILATAAVPLWTLFYYGLLFPNPHLTALVVIGVIGCALIIGKHHENIRRLMNRTENKIGKRVGPGSRDAMDGSAMSGGGGR